MKHTECLRPIDAATAARAAREFDTLRRTGKPFSLFAGTCRQPDGQVAVAISVAVNPGTVSARRYVISEEQMNSDILNPLPDF